MQTIDLGEVTIHGQGTHGMYVRLFKDIGVKLYSLESIDLAFGEFAILHHLRNVHFTNGVYGIAEVIAKLPEYDDNKFIGIFQEHISGEITSTECMDEDTYSKLSDLLDTYITILQKTYGIGTNDHSLDKNNVMIDDNGDMKLIDFSYSWYNFWVSDKDELIENAQAHYTVHNGILNAVNARELITA